MGRVHNPRADIRHKFAIGQTLHMANDNLDVMVATVQRLQWLGPSRKPRPAYLVEYTLYGGQVKADVLEEHMLWKPVGDA